MTRYQPSYDPDYGPIECRTCGVPWAPTGQPGCVHAEDVLDRALTWINATFGNRGAQLSNNDTCREPPGGTPAAKPRTHGKQL
jgi:hypothetical protein